MARNYRVSTGPHPRLTDAVGCVFLAGALAVPSPQRSGSRWATTPNAIPLTQRRRSPPTTARRRPRVESKIEQDDHSLRRAERHQKAEA